MSRSKSIPILKLLISIAKLPYKKIVPIYTPRSSLQICTDVCLSHLSGCVGCVPSWGCVGGTMVKSLPADAGDSRDTDTGSIPGSGRSPGGGHGNPLQYSCLENPMDRGAWWATVHNVLKSQTLLKLLSTHTYGEFLWENTSPPWPLGLSALSGQRLF